MWLEILNMRCQSDVVEIIANWRRGRYLAAALAMLTVACIGLAIYGYLASLSQSARAALIEDGIAPLAAVVGKAGEYHGRQIAAWNQLRDFEPLLSADETKRAEMQIVRHAAFDDFQKAGRELSQQLSTVQNNLAYLSDDWPEARALFEEIDAVQGAASRWKTDVNAFVRMISEGRQADAWRLQAAIEKHLKKNAERHESLADKFEETLLWSAAENRRPAAALARTSYFLLFAAALLGGMLVLGLKAYRLASKNAAQWTLPAYEFHYALQREARRSTAPENQPASASESA